MLVEEFGQVVGLLVSSLLWFLTLGRSGGDGCYRVIVIWCQYRCGIATNFAFTVHTVYLSWHSRSRVNISLPENMLTPQSFLTKLCSKRCEIIFVINGETTKHSFFNDLNTASQAVIARRPIDIKSKQRTQCRAAHCYLCFIPLWFFYVWGPEFYRSFTRFIQQSPRMIRWSHTYDQQQRPWCVEGISQHSFIH